MMTTADQLASLIGRAFAGKAVSMPDAAAELKAALEARGIKVDERADAAVFTGLPDTGAADGILSSYQAILVHSASGPGDLRGLLQRAAMRGLLPDVTGGLAEDHADWLLLRRHDLQMARRLDGLEVTAADLEAERHRLREQLRRVNHELYEVKTSPAWQLVGRYRSWLEKNRTRQKKSLPFLVYDRVTGAVLRSRMPDAVAKQESSRALGEGLLREPVAALRFTPHASSVDDWRRVFRGLARHAGVDREVAEDAPAPRISILTPLWNTKPSWLAEAAVSLFDQTETRWEWLLVDDCSTNPRFEGVLQALVESSPRIKFARMERNGGISAATNQALAAARGEFVACLDHDDLLHPEALAVCLDRLEEGGFDAVYTDSDKSDEQGILSEPFYKPDWSPEYFRAVMYVGHLLVVRREQALEVGGFDGRFDGVQDFEFFLRYSERNPKIAHVARVLYHWRRVEGSTAGSESAKKNINALQQGAVAAQLERLGIAARTMKGARPHRVTVAPVSPRKTTPRISIVIPTKDSPEVLGKCLNSIAKRTTYPNYQVICADNETQNAKALELMKRPGIERVLCPGKFNFSRVNNVAARVADGDFLLFLNNDIEVITKDWLEQMLYHAEQPDAGAVGALLLFPDRTIQHCGIALGFRGTADHILRRAESGADGYAGSLAHARECSAVTAACLMVRRTLFEEVGGFNEHYFTAYQDVDLCLRFLAKGKRNIYTPRATLIHYESYTRKEYYDWVDRNLLLDFWEPLIEAGDPYYNINFDREHTDYQVAPDADRGADPEGFNPWSLSGRAG